MSFWGRVVYSTLEIIFTFIFGVLIKNSVRKLNKICCLLIMFTWTWICCLRPWHTWKLFPFKSGCLILLAAVSVFTVFTDKRVLIKGNKDTRQKGLQVLGRKLLKFKAERESKIRKMEVSDLEGINSDCCFCLNLLNVLILCLSGNWKSNRQNMWDGRGDEKSCSSGWWAVL